jgi:hypothetical protein
MNMYLFSIPYVAARMSLLDQLLTMLEILVPNRKTRQVDAIQMLKITSGS